MRFNPDLSQLIPAEHLEEEFGGKFKYEFDQKEYWEQVCAYVIHTSIVPLLYPDKSFDLVMPEFEPTVPATPPNGRNPNQNLPV